MCRWHIISCSVVGWTWLKAPSMSWVSTTGRRGLVRAMVWWGLMLMASAMGVIVRRSASMAELSDCAPIWEWEVAPLVRAAGASLLATRVCSSLPKHDSREMGLYAFGSLYVGLPFLGMTIQEAVFHSGGWTACRRQALKRWGRSW